jgi:hypothetical protein
MMRFLFIVGETGGMMSEQTCGVTGVWFQGPTFFTGSKAEKSIILLDFLLVTQHNQSLRLERQAFYGL